MRTTKTRTTNSSKPRLLYGAYGYTGSLIAQAAAGSDVSLLLSGRREAPLAELAGRLELPWRRLELDDRAKLVKALEDCAGVLNYAGPFARTAGPMIDACLTARRHYHDITGEIEVFKLAHRKDEAARTAGSVLCPGVGFDVVPTDCLAAALKNALTRDSSLAAIRRLNQDLPEHGGYYTPSQVFGAHFLETLPNVGTLTIHH